MTKPLYEREIPEHARDYHSIDTGDRYLYHAMPSSSYYEQHHEVARHQDPGHFVYEEPVHVVYQKPHYSVYDEPHHEEAQHRVYEEPHKVVHESQSHFVHEEKSHPVHYATHEGPVHPTY